MKITIIAFLFLSLTACAGGAKPAQVNIPSGADFKTAVSYRRSSEGNKIEVTFFYTKPVAPRVKSDEGVTSVPVEDARFNGEPLVAATNEAGRTVYTLSNFPAKTDNLVSAKLNGKFYEAKLAPQTTIDDRSVTAVMVPK